MSNERTVQAISIHKNFEQIVVQYPDKTAVKILGNGVSYKELNARANNLANHLQSIGVQHGNIVAIALFHSVELVIAMIAVLKCGAAYLPIDEKDPEQRNRAYIEDAKARVIISVTETPKAFAKDLKIISTEIRSLFSNQLNEFESYQSKADDGAYVMFTSGSTGKPKGVLVPHRAVVRLVKKTNYIQIRPSDTILQFAPPAFDASTFEFWGALLNGASLVPYSGSVLDPNILKNDIKNNEVSILWLTAALFHLVAGQFIEALIPLRVLLAGGDVLNPKYVNKILDTIPNITLINGYGPTENTTFTCCHVMTKDNKPEDNVLIGKPITGTDVHVLDDMLSPVNNGEVGELYVSGKGVALGYLNDKNQNTAFFCNETIATGLIYRTGDLVKENNQGEFKFIGRKDNQVKIRGHRVSLEEIKTSIVELDNVSDAIVLTKSFDSGDQLLVAYVQIVEGRQASIKSIKIKLSSVLPNYMIPDQFVLNSNLPINENGKIDKNKI